MKMNAFQKTIIRGFPYDFPVLSFLLIHTSTAGLGTCLALKKCHHSLSISFNIFLNGFK